MREVTFSRKNGSRWVEFESYLSKSKKFNPDRLARLFIELTDDLAYAQTFYPESKTTQYLNQLAVKAHQALYKRSQGKKFRLGHFFFMEYPLVLYKNRRKMFYSFLFVLFAALIGAVSVANDDGFARLILGDDYVNMTLKNIEEGKPMAVYESESSANMFFAISWNNIKVSFIVFAAGILFSVGTYFLLFTNGLMIGVFQYFLYQKGLFLSSFLTIWLHGTIEIFSIIVAGASGMLVGNSILFPGTHSRGLSLRRGAMEGVKMLVGLIPFFLIAGFIESYITRYSDYSVAADWTIIAVSAAILIFYFFIYPIVVYKKYTNRIVE
ncbi:MAG: stage II sporulation protein M [Bacteroidetes bacterium]|nr:MAG: stage II sporulation protein M [Bacteroidota bacterium]